MDNAIRCMVLDSDLSSGLLYQPFNQQGKGNKLYSLLHVHTLYQLYKLFIHVQCTVHCIYSKSTAPAFRVVAFSSEYGNPTTKHV